MKRPLLLCVLLVALTAAGQDPQLVSETRYYPDKVTRQLLPFERTTYQYNAAGRETLIKNYNYHPTSHKAYLRGSVERNYNTAGQITLERHKGWRNLTDTLESIHENIFTYNSQGKLVTEVNKEKNLLTGYSYNTQTSLEYNINGCLVRATSGENQNNHVTYVTDALCRILRVNQSDTRFPEYRTADYYSYGPNGLESQRRYTIVGTDSTLDQEYLYTRDSKGRPLQWIYTGYSRNDFSYDQAGNVIATSQYAWQNNAWVLVGQNQISYTADGQQAVVKVTYLNNGSPYYEINTAYSYNSDKQMTRAETTLSNYGAGNTTVNIRVVSYRCDGVKETETEYNGTEQPANLISQMGYGYSRQATCDPQATAEILNTYPNPSDGIVYVSPQGTADLNGAQVRIYTSSGKLTREFILNSTGLPAELDVRDLGPGFYILELDQGGRQSRKRLLRR